MLDKVPTKTRIEALVEQVQKLLGDADGEMLGGASPEYEGYDAEELASYFIERAFVTLGVLAEAVGLPGIRQELQQLQAEARVNGFTSSKMGDEEPYLVWGSRLRQYVDAIAQLHGLKKSEQTLLAELKEVVQRTEYFLSDSLVFLDAPKSEKDVHDRIEGVLRCYFPDLMRKPALAKPVKNYEPDSGIPSLKTLIEYKFIKTAADAKRVADEILADTRGYASKQWPNILFVIYETKRVKSEKEWSDLLSECDLDAEHYGLVVLRGEPVKKK
ncbi:hypothetical protein [Variovorax sp. E3]|uniref:PD-(D/E)XK nuclease domain-containing protein n=1 Tax=Variovorax sp. E3 TaxID=1914993 RepID=UPI0018DECAB5|nr:hypothetical protein [Variovorax sp. E3]